VAARYKLKTVNQDGGISIFDQRTDTGDLNSRMSFINNTLNTVGAGWLQYGDDWLENSVTVPQQHIIEMRETYYDDNGNVVGTYLDEYFFSVDIKRTVKQFYDPNNPFDLSVADRV